jgi:phytoene dehydrogenase-like protein
MNDQYDTIVIGSGAGGMTAALALAMAGQKVLICEKHKAAGGWTHTFSKEGYKFNTGVHYVGDLHKGGQLRAIYEGLGVSEDLVFLEMNPDAYDHFLIGDERFDMPAGESNLQDRLIDRFPKEEEGIRLFLKKIHAINNLTQAFSNKKWLYLATHFYDLKWFRKTAGDLADHCFTDPLLKAVVCAQVGIHGMPPNRLAAPFYAAGFMHYILGGYHPYGGGMSISKAYLKRFKELGGEVRLGCTVRKINVLNKTANGVELDSGEKISSRYVISNADPGYTYLNLIGKASLSRRLVGKISKARYSTSCISLFLAVDLDLKSMGFDSGNYWIYDDQDLDRIYTLAYTDQNALKDPDGLFVTITTLKDPKKMRRDHHQIEVFVLCNFEAFSGWSGTKKGQRGAKYEAFKEEIMNRMIGKLEKLMPGVREAIIYKNLATPLTNEHYVNAPLGNIYGIEKSVDQIGPGSFKIKSEINNLFLCGASTTSHGIGGATQSGLLAAAAVKKCRPTELLISDGPSLRIFPAEQPENWPEHMKN